MAIGLLDQRSEAIEPFAELGIILRPIFGGLHISFRSLHSMRSTVLRHGRCRVDRLRAPYRDRPARRRNLDLSIHRPGLALALILDRPVLPITGVDSSVGRSSFAMLLFEDLALVPMLFLIELIGGHAQTGEFLGVFRWTCSWSQRCSSIGRFALPSLFAQAARTKSPELFLAISLLTVIVASLATARSGSRRSWEPCRRNPDRRNRLSCRGRGDHCTPLTGLALGIFLITMGMRIDLNALIRGWPLIVGAAGAILIVKAMVTAGLLHASGIRPAWRSKPES